MNNKIIYLDHSASTPLHPIAWQEMATTLPNFGNPSSLHSLGQKAKYLLTQYRCKIAELCSCEPEEIIFTSGATESNNFILQATALQDKKNILPHFIISPLEHSSILETALYLAAANQIELSIIPINKKGIIKIEDLIKIIKPNTKLISITTASNEIGTIQPVIEIAAIANEKGIFFHTDATQSITSMELNLKKNSFTSISLSSQKIYGPKGVGLLYLKKNTKLKPLIYGGIQEKGLRAGTENIMAISGFCKAFELCSKERVSFNQKMLELSSFLDYKIETKVPQAKLTGDKEKRLCFHRNYVIANCEIEQLLIWLDLQGICVSSGSACNTGRKKASFALIKMGYSKSEANNSLRVSLGRDNDKAQIEFFVTKLEEFFKNNK